MAMLAAVDAVLISQSVRQAVVLGAQRGAAAAALPSLISPLISLTVPPVARHATLLLVAAKVALGAGTFGSGFGSRRRMLVAEAAAEVDVDAPAQEATREANAEETLAAVDRLDSQRVIQRSGCVSGAQLRRLRRQAGWTQRELAERLSYSQQEVSAWEAGRYLMPLSLARQLLDLLLEAKQGRDNYEALLRGIERWPTVGEW